MQKSAAEQRIQESELKVTVEDIAVIHKVNRILRTGKDVVLKRDSNGKTKVYRLSQEIA